MNLRTGDAHGPLRDAMEPIGSQKTAALVRVQVKSLSNGLDLTRDDAEPKRLASTLGAW